MNFNFFTKLEAFTDYNGAFLSSNYQDVPNDWYVIVTDVVNSTIAVEMGKYKDVNLIGSACIGAVISKGDFPFVFGGDGASFVVPPSKLEEIKSELRKVQNAAIVRYELDLRIGVVPVSDIVKQTSLKVARYELSKGRCIAKFSGGGLSYADELIKTHNEYLLVNEQSNEQASFHGISCRWNPIKSQSGKILTLMVKTDFFENYKSIQTSLEVILGADAAKLNPVKPRKMSYMKMTEIYNNEKKYEASRFSLSGIKRKVEILIAFLLFKPLRSLQPKFLSHYTQAMQRCSDFRKFDDVIRMVVDCSEKQVEQIVCMLTSTPNTSFGYFCSDHALMTCLVFGLNDGEHIHFIDGANGGYTQAAKMMKSKELNRKHSVS